MDDLLALKKSKHYHQLKYLSSKHEAGILKVSFTLQPFSFLFLLPGGKMYYVVWETLDTKEATYIWYAEQTRDALRRLSDQIGNDLADIESAGRQLYIAKQIKNFFRVIHDYNDVKKGFIMWKAMLEQQMI